MLCLTNPTSVGVPCPYKQEIFSETRERRKTTAAMILGAFGGVMVSKLD